METNEIQARHDAYNHGPVWNAFGCTRAAYFVVARRALQSMPVEWQEQFVALMDQLHETIADADGDYSVTLRENGRIVQDWRRDYRHTGPMPLKAITPAAQESEP
jgi:hypothetical protein